MLRPFTRTRALFSTALTLGFLSCGKSDPVATSNVPSADASGGAGTTGGGAGVAGPGDKEAGDDIDAGPCGLGAMERCDDVNPCTADHLDATCTCRHDPVDDGTPCDDGDVCTESDQCGGGVCAGSSRPGGAKVLGSVRTFGDAPGLLTLVTLPSEDRAVFATRRTLTLVEIGPETLQVLDRHEMGTGLQIDNVSSMIWVPRQQTFLVSLGANLLAFIGRGWGIDLYDLTADRLTPSERYGFAGTEGEVRAAAGRGDRLFTCVSSQIQAYRINPTTHDISQGNMLALPLGHTCQGLAITPDGAALMVATAKGLDVLDISSGDGVIAHKRTALGDRFLLDVAVTDTYIAVYNLEQMYSGLGNVVLLDPSAMTQIGSFPLEQDVTGPIGFAATASGLLLQRARWQGCSDYVAELYGLDTTPLEPRSQTTILDACLSVYGSVPVHTVALGQHAVLEPLHELVRIDPSGGTMVPLKGLEQGSFERVRAHGATTIEAHGPTSMHLVDISDPGAPTIRAGGLVLPSNAEWLRVAISPDGEAALLTVPSATMGLSGPVTALYWDDGSGLPTVAGSIANSDAESEWVASGRFLYQLVAAVTGEPIHVRRFPASVTRKDRQHLLADIDQALTVEAPAGLERRLDTWFSVDPKTHDLAVLERRGHASDSTTSRSIVSMFSADESSYRLVATGDPQARSPVGVGAVKGRAVVAYRDGVSLSFSQANASVIFDPKDIVVDTLLGVTEKVVYLAVTLTGAMPPTRGVLVLQTDNLSEIARYPTTEPVLSVAEVGANLAFGAASTLAVATPACAAKK